MQLVDIGANLSHESFAADFDTVVDEARAAGVAHIMLTGTDLANSEAALAMARQRPDYFSSTAGFHPHIAQSVSDADLARLETLVAHPRVVAVGETGLDFHRNFSPRQDQLRVFEGLLALAVAARKPLFLHQRDAHDAFLPLLKKYRDRLVGGVVHCFTDSGEALDDYLALDMYVGITGWICDERRGRRLQELVARIPDERLLIETDAPYLLPRTLQPRPKSRRNEPRFLSAILAEVAARRGQSASEVARLTTANAVRLFSLPLAPGAAGTAP